MTAVETESHVSASSALEINSWNALSEPWAGRRPRARPQLTRVWDCKMPNSSLSAEAGVNQRRGPCFLRAQKGSDLSSFLIFEDHSPLA